LETLGWQDLFHLETLGGKDLFHLETLGWFLSFFFMFLLLREPFKN
jgi:hypothetical protein